MDSPVQLKADLTKSSEMVTGGFMDIIAKFKDWLLLPRQAKALAKAELIKAQADTNKKLIKAGLMIADVNGKATPLFDQKVIASFLLGSQARKVENLQACLEQAAIELEEAKPNQISENIDEDFFDEWIDTASKRNSGYARKLWGRILARKLIEPDSISLRALHVLRQMDKNEAEAFRRVAPYALESFIIDCTGSEIAPGDAILLSDAGILESVSRVGSYVSCPGDPAAYSGAQWGLLVHLDATKLDEDKVLEVGGHALTPTGQKLLKVPDLEPITQDVLKVIFDGLQERNGNIISISAHPMLGKDMIDTSITYCEYKPD